MCQAAEVWVALGGPKHPQFVHIALVAGCVHQLHHVVLCTMWLFGTNLNLQVVGNCP